ncbi:hypothetical protein [Glaciihabitans sp. UYNi722]|uniref:hypothetical protein n=1 Tax=Glaciihabitans sp. UYNi722 TaxID=3156344 RepID=UPI0033921A02
MGGFEELVDGTGATVRLAAGNTWIELVPLAGSVAFVAPAEVSASCNLTCTLRVRVPESFSTPV